MNFNDNTNRAIYLQIADRISDEILTGIFASGERLPSVRERAAELEVNANTMMRSYDYLQQQGLIFNKRGIGYFVADDAPIRILSHRRSLFFEREVDYFYERMRIFGVKPEELADSYRTYCVKKES